MSRADFEALADEPMPRGVRSWIQDEAQRRRAERDALAERIRRAVLVDGLHSLELSERFGLTEQAAEQRRTRILRGVA